MERSFFSASTGTYDDGFTVVVCEGRTARLLGERRRLKFMDEYVKVIHGMERRSKRRNEKFRKEAAAFYAFQIHEKEQNDACLSLFGCFAIQPALTGDDGHSETQPAVGTRS